MFFLPLFSAADLSMTYFLVCVNVKCAAGVEVKVLTSFHPAMPRTDCCLRREQMSSGNAENRLYFA